MGRVGLIAVAMVFAFVIGGVSGWLIGRGGGLTVQVLEGYTGAVNSTGEAISLSPRRGEGGPGYDISGVWWRRADVGGAWTKTSPTCIAPLTYGQRVRLGTVDVPATGDAPGGVKVLWVECLDMNAVPMSSSAVDAARVRLAAELGITVGDIKVESVDEVQWSNTSLGCPEPDRMYADVIVPGFRVQLEHQGRQYEYHTNEDGSMVVRC